MPRLSPAVLAILAIAALGGCRQAIDPALRETAPAAEAIGPADDCIRADRIGGTVVHDDRTIDFHMVGRDVYRSTLPRRCPGLGFEERFIYSPSGGQLCSTDLVSVLYSNGMRGPACRLGPFVPVRIERAGER